MFAKYVTSTYEIKDTYNSILLDIQDAEVKIEPSNDNSTKLVLFEKRRNPYRFFIENGTLTIVPTKTKWYNSLRVGIDHSNVTLYVPKSTLDAISVKANVGDVEISSINSTGAIDVKTNTGKINVSDVSCKTFSSKENTGSIMLSNVTATDTIHIKGNVGRVSLNDCAAPEIFVKTNTGKVSGKLAPNVVFTVKTTTGKIQVPKAPIGETICGRCEIKTNTGSVMFE